MLRPTKPLGVIVSLCLVVMALTLLLAGIGDNNQAAALQRDAGNVTAAGQTADTFTAFTGAAGFVSGRSKGTAYPPDMSPDLAQRRESMQRLEASRPTANTPIDSRTASQSKSIPIPPSNVVDLSGSSHGNSPASALAARPVFWQNSEVDVGHGSLVDSPSHASLPNSVVLATWNWYSAVSTDSGASWVYYDPAAVFSDSYGGFCCNQIAYYDPDYDLTFWVLQYTPDISDNNAIRLAWAKGPDAVADVEFCHTDFTPQQIGSPSGTYYDQPKFARSDGDVYLEAMRYGVVTSSVVIRIAADQFAWPNCTGLSLSYQAYLPGLYSPGFTQRAYDTMYFAAHVNTSTLRVYTWPETSTGVLIHDVAHTAYPQNYPYSCPHNGGSPTSDWCQHPLPGGGWGHDDRVSAGWIGDGTLNFMWDASQGSAGGRTFNYPYVHVVRIDPISYTLIDEPVMYNDHYAFAYASAGVNGAGEVAGMVMYGGGNLYQNCAAFVWDAITGPPLPWAIYLVRESNSDPNDVVSGDYLATRQNGSNGYTWTGSCYALVGGRDDSHVQTYYVWFGRYHTFLPTILKDS